MANFNTDGTLVLPNVDSVDRPALIDDTIIDPAQTVFSQNDPAFVRLNEAVATLNQLASIFNSLLPQAPEPFTGIIVNEIRLAKVTVTPDGTPPLNPTIGEIWIRTDLPGDVANARVWNGTEFAEGVNALEVIYTALLAAQAALETTIQDNVDTSLAAQSAQVSQAIAGLQTLITDPAQIGAATVAQGALAEAAVQPIDLADYAFRTELDAKLDATPNAFVDLLESSDAGRGLIVNALCVDYTDIKNTPTTLAEFGFTDVVTLAQTNALIAASETRSSDLIAVERGRIDALDLSKADQADFAQLENAFQTFFGSPPAGANELAEIIQSIMDGQTADAAINTQLALKLNITDFTLPNLIGTGALTFTDYNLTAALGAELAPFATTASVNSGLDTKLDTVAFTLPNLLGSAPRTLADFNITNAVEAGDLADVATTGLYSDLIGRPITIAGFGITDAVTSSEIDNRVTTAQIVQSNALATERARIDVLDATKADEADLAPVATSGLFSDLTNTPTTLAGYGITDSLLATDLADIATTGNYSDLIGVPTTLAGFGITDAVTLASLADVATSGLFSDLTGTPTNLAGYGVTSVDASEINTGVFDPARIPPSVRATPAVSSGDLTALTAMQQDAIGEGSSVVVADGRVFYYSGTGPKTAEASYVEGADATPAISQITGLQMALDGKLDATTAAFVTQVQALDATQVTAVRAALGIPDEPTILAEF